MNSFFFSTCWAYIDDEVKQTEHMMLMDKNVFIEEGGEMNIIGYTTKDNKLYCYLPVDNHWYNLPFGNRRVHVTVLDGIYYIITESLTFRIFDSINKTVEKFKPFEAFNFSFDDLQLTSHNSRIYLLAKSRQNLHVFDTSKKIWAFLGTIYTSHKLIGLTSTHLPWKYIRTPLKYLPFKCEIQSADFMNL